MHATSSQAGSADRLFGGAGRDSLFGCGGADVVRGGAGADFLGGAAGADRLFGGPHTDFLNGGIGNDFLSARDDWADDLVGGPGVDVARVDRRLDEAGGVERFVD